MPRGPRPLLPRVSCAASPGPWRTPALPEGMSPRQHPLTARLDAGRAARGHHNLQDLPEEGVVYLEAPEAGPVGPDVDEGQTGEVEAGEEGEERSVENSH